MSVNVDPPLARNAVSVDACGVEVSDPACRGLVISRLATLGRHHDHRRARVPILLFKTQLWNQSDRPCHEGPPSSQAL